jgi:hypothetical protein
LTEDGITGDTAFTRRAFVNAVRERRLAPVKLYQESIAKKSAIRNQRTLDLLNKQSAMMEKELAALDKALAKVEARAVTIAALTNQVELSL